jgi:hypothetical protein
MTYVDVTTSEALTAVLADQAKGTGSVPCLIGEAWNSWDRAAVLRGSSHAVLRGSSHAVLRGSSHAELWDSSDAVLRDSSHAVLRGSSHAELRGSSHAVLWGSAVVRAFGTNRIRAHTPYAVIIIMPGATVDATGGMMFTVPAITTMTQWCGYYGIPVVDGQVVLYKAVRDDYRSARGVLYAPGSMPEAPDWDGGEAECGGGLHLTCHPHFGVTASFGDPQATRFLACPVRLEDVRPPQPSDQYPEKVKVRRICGPIVEVDRHGTPLKEKKA